MDEADRGQVSTDAAEVYESLFVPALFSQFVAPMMQRVPKGKGTRVLDVACGTGVLTRGLAEHLDATGVDINAGMIAVARDRAPDVQFEVGAAESLPFDDASFDAVTCQFALMFFEDRAQALAEMLRVVRPGGTVVLAVWDAIENSPGYAAMARLLDRLFGPDVARALHAPFNLGDAQALRAVLQAGGLRGATVETLGGTARFPSLDAWVETDVKGWTLADLIDDAQFETLQAAARDELTQFVADDKTVSFAAAAHIVTFARPRPEA